MTYKADPARAAAAVTPSDSTNLSATTVALYIGGAGNVSVQIGGATVVFVGALAGSFLPIQCNRVNSTGTTATSIVALY